MKKEKEDGRKKKSSEQKETVHVMHVYQSASPQPEAPVRVMTI